MFCLSFSSSSADVFTNLSTRRKSNHHSQGNVNAAKLVGVMDGISWVLSSPDDLFEGQSL